MSEYARAGVSLDAQEEMNRIAVEAARRVAARLGARVVGLGGYAAGIELGAGLYSLHTDGVGTKTVVLERLGRLWVAGWDCVAMNVNDLAVDGYEPVALTDYVVLPRGDVEAFREVMRGLEAAAVEAGAPILGGETAIMPGVAGGVDVACTALGRRVAEPRSPGPGDLVVGLSSSGLHANGYSLVRRVLEEQGVGYDSTVDGVDLGEELSKPTVIYSRLLLGLYRDGVIKTAAHLTGGGWAKLLRVLAPGLRAVLRAPEPPRVFRLIQRLGGISTREMYSVFNMGVGAAVVVAGEEEAEEVAARASAAGLRAWVLGRVEASEGPPALVVEAQGERIVLGRGGG